MINSENNSENKLDSSTSKTISKTISQTISKTSTPAKFQLNQPRIYDVASLNQLYLQASNFIVGCALDAVGEDGSFRLALSGGATPLPVYSNLSKDSVFPFEQTELYQVDERIIANNLPESNQFQLQQAFGPEKVSSLKAFYPFNTNSTPEKSILEYNSILDSLDQPFFDLVILGIGSDGHIASIFPYSDLARNLNEDLQIDPKIDPKNSEFKNKFASLAVAPSEYEVSQRFTLTLPSILSSKKIMVILSGLQKAEVVKELIEGKKHISEFPAKWLLTHPDLTIFQCLSDE